MCIRDRGDGGLARVGLGLGADLQFAVQHDPLGGQLQVGGVGEGELAVDGQATQCRRGGVGAYFLACLFIPYYRCPGPSWGGLGWVRYLSKNKKLQ